MPILNRYHIHATFFETGLLTIVANATKTNGAAHPLVLLHSGKASHEPDSAVSPFRGNTVAALPTIIQWYLDHGYRFVRLDGRS